jgi:TonB family protein
MLEQLERQEAEEQQIEQPRLVTSPAFPVENDQRQRRRMVVALILLLVALGLVLVKDRDFWFPSTPEVADSDGADEQVPVATTDSATPAASVATPSVSTSRRQSKHAPVAAKSPQTFAPPPPPATVARAVLPPLRVEVVAGDSHQMVRTTSPSVKVDLQPGTVVPSAAAATPDTVGAAGMPLTNAGERVEMSKDNRQALATRPVRPEYPLLARQMKVEGAVSLNAQIGRDGGIQNLHVVGGPAILADAAQQAVKQWRFKPYYQDGQPVETQVPITVVFTISTK